MCPFLAYLPSMERIPVQFDYEGIWFDGYFVKIAGAASGGLYHLMINGTYWGQLWKTENYGWRFGSSNDNNMFEELYMVDFFVSVIEGKK